MVTDERIAIARLTTLMDKAIWKKIVDLVPAAGQSLSGQDSRIESCFLANPIPYSDLNGREASWRLVADWKNREGLAQADVTEGQADLYWYSALISEDGPGLLQCFHFTSRRTERLKHVKTFDPDTGVKRFSSIERSYGSVYGLVHAVTVSLIRPSHGGGRWTSAYSADYYNLMHASHPVDYDGRKRSGKDLYNERIFGLLSQGDIPEAEEEIAHTRFARITSTEGGEKWVYLTGEGELRELSASSRVFYGIDEPLIERVGGLLNRAYRFISS